MADPPIPEPRDLLPKPQLKPRARALVQVALRTSLIYGIAAAAYILLSDRIVEAAISDPAMAARVQTYKGWAFVTVTALLLYAGLRAQLRRWEREALERRRAEDALRARIMQIQAILAHQPIAFFASDRAGVITLWEGRTWPEVKFPPVDITGRNLLELAGGQAAMRAALERALHGETTAIEHRVQGRTFEVFPSPLRDGDGQPMGVSGVVVDITDTKKLEAQLLRAQRLESVGRLAGGVAHDLNNILSPVLIGASLLRTRIPDADSQGLLETIEASARRGAEIIRQMLIFSRGAAGEIASVPLASLVADMRSLVRETFPRNISVRVDVPAEPLAVLGDSTQLHQVLMNLCVNARDAMPEGGTLTLGLAPVEIDEARAAENPGAKPGPHVVLRVRDTGTGIPAEHTELIFDPFFTTKELGQGTGLGLSTVRGIVKGHGGFIRLETTVGTGTEFSVFLPRAPAAAPGPEKGTGSAGQKGRGECVLIVDDEASVRRVLRLALETAGYRVVEAEDGASGLARFNEHRHEVRLIVTDVMMPSMDGLGLVRAVRAIAARLPVISISGVDRPVKHEDLKALGVAVFLEKPFALDELLEAVRGCLRAASAAVSPPPKK